MKELDYPATFWNIVYWDVLDFSKKIWGQGAPPYMGPEGPKMPYFKQFGGARAPYREGPPDPKIFLRSPGHPNRLCSKNYVGSPAPSWIFLSPSD